MKQLSRTRYLLAVLVVVAAVDGESVMLGGDYDERSVSDPNFEIALSAVHREDWDGAIAALRTLVERRAFDDDAHTLLGYAYRKKGDYDASLKSYRRALELNPHHRGALEYLGEAYLELGDRGRAVETLKRLAHACRQQKTPPLGEGWKRHCPEWRELDTAIRAHDSSGALNGDQKWAQSQRKGNR